MKNHKKTSVAFGMMASAFIALVGQASAQVEMDVTQQTSQIGALNKVGEILQEFIDFLAGQGGLAVLVIMVVVGGLMWSFNPKGDGMARVGRAIVVLAALPFLMQALAFFGVIGGVTP